MSLWVGDVTRISTGQGWLYLASVLDLGSGRLVGYSMADHMRTELVADALTMAAGLRGGTTTGIIFHGDRGSQYMSGDYRQQVTVLSTSDMAHRVEAATWPRVRLLRLRCARLATWSESRRAPPHSFPPECKGSQPMTQRQKHDGRPRYQGPGKPKLDWVAEYLPGREPSLRGWESPSAGTTFDRQGPDAQG